MSYHILNPLVLLILLLAQYGNCQEVISNPSEGLYQYHSAYKADFITHRRFKHAEIMEYLGGLSSPLKVRTVGRSIDGKAIKMVSFGTGESSVLLWSQMHGNEPTATMALMDIFRFLGDSDYEFDDFRKLLEDKLTIHFIPMLNPDGGDRFVRRNSQFIDINRDALRQQTPEGQTLKKVRDSLDADWGFNLHDQGRQTAVADKPATISMLAPAYDYERSVNEKRGNAMQLIAMMDAALQKYIPHQVGRYGDAFEPRAFGDNIQKWGTRTILIESGGYPKDREKQEIRRINFMLILTALYGIAEGTFEQYTTDDYMKIPGNSGGLRDLIIRNVQLPESLGGHLTDLAYNFIERENESGDNYYLTPYLVDAGDLSTSSAYLIYDVSGLKVELGKTFEDEYEALGDLRKAPLKKLLRKGYTDFVVNEPYDGMKAKYLPIRINTNENPNNQNGLQSIPSLLFIEDTKVKYALINGYFFAPGSKWKDIVKGIDEL